MREDACLTRTARPRVIRHVPDYRGEPAHGRYSDDREWMPELVLIAKNTHVWLDQLSRKYGRPVITLADIPDEELDMLASRGLTGLWLIGIWERSPASRRLKQRMGQPDAAASAYSIYDYEVAADLGGEAAVADLQARAIKRGIRLSADMVPNHMGIDSRWVIEHPERFISLDRTAVSGLLVHAGEPVRGSARRDLPGRSLLRPDRNGRGIQARRDADTGSVRYVYHGNDGTSFAWNDTAQLDYSRPDVREAVTQTILRRGAQVPHHPLRCGHDAGQGAHPAPVVPSAGTRRTASRRAPGTG